jgi:DNA-directed RNA polymerase
LTTFEDIGAQIKLEREQIKRGLEKLHNNTQQLEDKSYASASVYGVASIGELVPLVAQRIQDTRLRIRKGTAGVNFKEILVYLNDLDAESAAAIACKVTLDKVFSTKPKANKVSNITDAIGIAIEDECMLRHYEAKVPGLLHKLQEAYWHSSCGTRQKVKQIKTLMNRYDVPQWKAWGRATRVRLGGWLLDCLCQSSDWFMVDQRQEGSKRQNYIVPTPEFSTIKEEVMATAELFSPIAWPMIVEPNDWQPDGTGGGYILNELMAAHSMVRRGNKQCIQGETPINFLNHIQKVAYTLNPFIVDVARTLMERGIAVGKFIPVVETPLPPKPVDIANNAESRKDYRRRAAEAMNINSQQFKRSCRTRMTMNAVDVFEKYEKFHCPWSFDYRGRCYPIPAFLTPQDTDFGKSLLKFHQQALMTPDAEQWLAFQVATTAGLDKDTMEDRQKWAKDNQWLIEAVATDPVGNLSTWEGMDEPWQFLAACDEYYHCVMLCDRNYTNLPVAVDATCSGLQILAGLARDASTAKLVNVLPGDKPQDAYKVIAEEAKPNIPDSVKPYCDRKLTKRTVMTVPYNAKPYSNRGYIREALKDKGVEVDKDDLTATVKAVRDAMNVIVPGPMRVMKWIETEVSNAIDRGLKELTWVTPSGFVVTQKLMKKQIQRIELQLLGNCNIFIATGDKNEVDKSHHKNATAPNLIHSLDASHLCLSALRFNAPLALIHDSVLCRATDMSVLSTIVRETYMYLFAEHDYLKSWAEQIGAESDPPIIGTLNPESVIESTYFFC